MEKSVLYICYYDVNEPLVETQVVAYLREITRAGFKIHLLTFDRQRMTRAEQQCIRDGLSKVGIQWHALRYHQRPSLPATVYDIAVGSIWSLLLCYRFKIGLIHARSHVATAMGLLAQRVFGCKLLFDVRGLLAEEYADAGHWSVHELKYRLTKRIERVLFQKADALVMLTQRIKTLLVQHEPALSGRAGEITVIPCCADTGRFIVADGERSLYRQHRGWVERDVLTYVGKIGTWYLHDEMAQFFATALQDNPRFFFQILTQSDPVPMQQSLDQAGVDHRDYDIRCVTQEELPVILSSSDAGISFIRPCYSKQASSPTKIGEYLAAGLPVVVNSGIGDCDAMIRDQYLGTILQDFSRAEYHRAIQELISIMADETITRRCRGFSCQALSLSRIGGPRYTAIYQQLLS